MFCDFFFCIMFLEVRYFRGDFLKLKIENQIVFFNRKIFIMFYENRNSVK